MVLPDLENSAVPIHAGPLSPNPLYSSIYFNSGFIWSNAADDVPFQKHFPIPPPSTLYKLK
jgi:hypothetical protein